ncbi:insulin gene enhancer protein isl-1-like, partial [Glycine max]|uniref:insulin gene enhancer protein isl-1-like n=1 Tax=Glycine max TaxID=3847 RepID=UPI0003DECE39
KQRLSHCVGCGGQIHDQYILRVAPDLEWHAACLKCQECRQFLDESCTCFVRDGKTYCKRDYVRLFGTKCDKCGNSFSKNDFVMRAKTKIFHIECFRCSSCARQLLPGDEFALRDGGALYCKEDHDMLEKSSQSSLTSSSVESNNNISSSNNNNTNLSNNNHSSELGSMSDSGSESGSHKSIREKRPSGPSDGKPTRVRTVLNEKQLHTLRTCYNANPRPDALMKEQLVEMTGLSPRVIRPTAAGPAMNGPPGASSLDSGITSHHHPDSTDSYVTYLESDDKSKLALTPSSSSSASAATSISSPPSSAAHTVGGGGGGGGLGVGGVVGGVVGAAMGGSNQSATEQLMQMLQKVTGSPSSHAVL